MPTSLPEMRSMAEGFGENPELYDRTRPRYPEAMVRRIVASGPGRDLLDVGIGTGIDARQFREAGCEVLGVEPDERMAAFARRTGLTVEVSAFEKWDPAGRVFDLVASGQAWHWVDPVAGAAKAASALRPGGRLAVFWNAGQAPPMLADAMTALIRRHVPEIAAAQDSRPLASARMGYLRFCDAAAEGMRKAGAFAEPETWEFVWSRSYARDESLEQAATSGGLTRLKSEQLAEALTEVGAVIDGMGGSFEMKYTTVVATAVRG